LTQPADGSAVSARRKLHARWPISSAIKSVQCVGRKPEQDGRLRITQHCPIRQRPKIERQFAIGWHPRCILVLERRNDLRRHAELGEEGARKN
jgi:hypothetical protein